MASLSACWVIEVFFGSMFVPSVLVYEVSMKKNPLKVESIPLNFDLHLSVVYSTPREPHEPVSL